MTTPSPGRLMLNNVRIAFCHSVHKPEQVNGEGQYRRGAVLIIPFNHPQYPVIQKTIDALLLAKYPDPKKRAVFYNPPTFKGTCWDPESAAKLAKGYDGFENAGALSTNGKGGDTPEEAGPVILLDQLKQPLTAGSGKPYPGCYTNTSVELWVQDNKWGRRVNCTLRGIQYLRDGDAFGGGAPASADDFEAATEGADASDFA